MADTLGNGLIITDANGTIKCTGSKPLAPVAAVSDPPADGTMADDRSGYVVGHTKSTLCASGESVGLESDD